MIKTDKRTPLIAGNWKMLGSHAYITSLLEKIKTGVGAIHGVEWAVFPPAIYLPLVTSLLDRTPIAWGGQNLSEHPQGAYTGEISADMLHDLLCRYVLVGHSERRHLYGEDNDRVAAKWLAAKQAGLTPILCVGETLAQREAGQTEAIIEAQIQAVMDHMQDTALMLGAVIAYEPVWAIGTGQSATPEQAQAVHQHIREYLAKTDALLAKKQSILYGGSLKPTNARALFAMPDIDGGLIGGASLEAAAFLTIGELCSQYY
jgi:triosephosphate isomerase